MDSHTITIATHVLHVQNHNVMDLVIQFYAWENSRDIDREDRGNHTP